VPYSIIIYSFALRAAVAGVTVVVVFWLHFLSQSKGTLSSMILMSPWRLLQILH
jgi:hypothetical protein